MVKQKQSKGKKQFANWAERKQVLRMVSGRLEESTFLDDFFLWGEENRVKFKKTQTSSLYSICLFKLINYICNQKNNNPK